MSPDERKKFAERIDKLIDSNIKDIIESESDDWMHCYHEPEYQKQFIKKIKYTLADKYCRESINTFNKTMAG